MIDDCHSMIGFNWNRLEIRIVESSIPIINLQSSIINL